MTKWCWDLKDKQLAIMEDVDNTWNDFDTEEEARTWFHETMLKLVIGINTVPEFDYLSQDPKEQRELTGILVKQAQEYVKTLEV